ncbi:MAG: polyprenol monophosphomannose synthase [Planctomycetota bacterium]
MSDAAPRSPITTRSRPVEVAAPPSDRVEVTIVVPTFREHDNLIPLLDRLRRLRDQIPGLEVVFMDDPSGDGSQQLIDSMGEDWVSLVSRNGTRGLSPAVLEGFDHALGKLVVVMDADLSHPPEAIPAMLERLRGSGDRPAQDMVVGSRYVDGGSTQDSWGVFRWVNSAVATLLARPLTRVKDPMSGFFAVRRDAVRDASQWLNPIGYKIALELIVKCGFERVAEVPIHFGLRHAGESKLSLSEQLKYVRHLARLYFFVLSGGRRTVREVRWQHREVSRRATPRARQG